jgi:ribosomal protein L12E/L44/L45/RPP1/RPP2
LKNKELAQSIVELEFVNIEEALKKGLGDAQPAARATAKEGFAAFKCQWPERANR